MCHPPVGLNLYVASGITHMGITELTIAVWPWLLTMLGFLVLVSRRQAVTQVVGYLMLENGVFIFGQTLVEEIPFAVELGILLDLLVGVFVMGIAIYHISREFEHIDTELLSSLKD